MKAAGVKRETTRRGNVRTITPNSDGGVTVECGNTLLDLRPAKTWPSGKREWGVYHYQKNRRGGWSRHLPYYAFDTKRAAMASARKDAQ